MKKKNIEINDIVNIITVPIVDFRVTIINDDLITLVSYPDEYLTCVVNRKKII